MERHKIKKIFRKKYKIKKIFKKIIEIKIIIIINILKKLKTY